MVLFSNISTSDTVYDVCLEYRIIHVTILSVHHIYILFFTLTIIFHEQCVLSLLSRYYVIIGSEKLFLSVTQFSG